MKLFLRNLLCLTAAVILFAGCEKEYSIEGLFSGAGTTGGTAVFVLDGAPNLCNGYQVQGTYTAGTAVTSGNTVVLSVNVTTVGTWTLTTNAQNGFSFAGSGTFTATGQQLIQLIATGTPTASGIYNFQAGAAPCSFPVTVASAGPGTGGTSVFTFNGSPNACTTPTINGTYTQGTALTAANTVVLQANVTTAGTYNVTTTMNGITFTATGTFAATGPNQNVTFTGTGTPTAAGNINFQAGSTTMGCAFTIPVSPAGGGSLAQYTFAGAPNACTTPTINGTYTQGTAVTASNTVVLQVNVTVAGAYMASATNNGITFTSTGTFAATGNQTITLTASGTPTNAGPTNFVPTGASAPGCTFTIPVLPAAGGGQATFTFAGQPNACTTPTINGTYTQGTALNGTNTIVLQVNVTAAGTYAIGATANGMNFTAAGTFAATGVQSVTLIGSGTPTNSGAINFTPTSTSGAMCTFTITVAPGGGGGGAATFTFAGAPNACTTPTINGTYTQGTALTASNTVVLQVNVTTVGTYSVTATANGITFTGSGTFAATGAQSITLTGSGTPTASGATNFTPTGASAAGCTFTITVAASGPTIFIRATINGVPYEFNSSIQTLNQAGPPSGIGMLGLQSSPTATTAELQVFFVNELAALATGNFSNFATGVNETRYIDAYYTDNAGVEFTTDDNTANSFTGVLSTLSATAATGTFQGTLVDPLGGPTTVTVTNGSFSITF